MNVCIRRFTGRLHASITASFLALALALAGTSSLASAADSASATTDALLEARVMQVAEGLRCLVCQNETIAASQASLAVDLRAQIRAQLQQGQSDDQVRAHLVARYGDFVLYRPPLRASTVLLWFGPFALLIVALAWALRRLRAQRPTDAAAPLPPALTAQADALLGIGPVATDTRARPR